ncbi:MAG: OmpA family protein [Solirubrobacteraceae bacterium]|jgi:chemotaxis protein MotB
MARRRLTQGAHENEERWLLTYADMITLLMALFMVLFSISSVNISKYQTLQEALRAAFSGSVMPGGSSIQQTGNSPSNSQSPATTSEPVAIVPTTPSIGVNGGSSKGAKAALAAQVDQSNLQEVEKLIQSYVAAHGLANTVKTAINLQGLQITIESDHVLFASGSAELQPAATPLLSDISNLVQDVVPNNQIAVEGYTDSLPTHTSLYPSNWYLSTDRANAVLQFLLSRGISAQRLSAQGYASLDPVASNATAAGRAQNRRVVIGVERTAADSGQSLTVTQPALTGN